MTTIQYINLSLQIWGCILTAIIIVSIYVSETLSQNRKLYTRLLLINMGVMLFDALALCFRGRTGMMGFYGVRIFNFLAFCFATSLPSVSLDYVMSRFKNAETVTKVPSKIMRTMRTVYIGLYILNIFYPLFYRIDEHNIYHREPLYFMTFLPPLLVIVFFLYLLKKYRKQIDEKELKLLYLYVLIPIPVFLVQAFVYGLNLVNFIMMMILVSIFIFIQSVQGKRLVQQEKELLESRIESALSQIQPHFIYNTLNTIQYLNEYEPKKANEAIAKFSKYLRYNMDALKRKIPITFESEIEHVKNYIEIEAIRFPEVRFEFDLQCTGFFIPALTLQPIVENAIKHGVCKRQIREGGYVRITSEEYEDFYCIMVEDNGVGYQENIPNDGSSHVGILNVKERLKTMCNGTLIITGEQGVGTKAIITLQKGKNNESYCGGR